MLGLILTLMPEENRDRIRRLWEEYGDALIRAARGYLGGAATYKDAEDIVSEAFVRLIERCERYGGRTDDQMKALLLRTCRNLAVNEFRRGLRIPISSFEAEEEAGTDLQELSPPTPEDLTISGETVGRLKTVIQSLDEKYRDALTVKILEDLPDAAAAEELGISPGTFRTRLRRARRMVFEKWKEGEPSE